MPKYTRAAKNQKGALFIFALSLSLGFSAYNLSRPGFCLGDEVVTPGTLPVKEVTIFKDGHALVVREGKVALNGTGEASLEDLPTPMLGTFFPYSPDRQLLGVTAGRKKVEKTSTAISLAELLEANPGAAVSGTRTTRTRANGEAGSETSTPGGVTFQGHIAATPVPQISIAEQNKARKHDSTSGATTAIKSDLFEIENQSGGSTFLPISSLDSLSFAGPHQAKVKNETLEDTLTLHLAGGNGANSQSANVGLMYVSKGLRWIPSYKVTLNGNGRAKLTMQATLVNDLIDLDNVSTQLVVGVPSFAFEGEKDPMSLSRDLASVANQLDRDSFARNNLRNAIQVQSVSADMQNESDAEAKDRQGNQISGSRHEDLYVFSLKHVSLKKGERMVLPVSECEVSYEDLYVLDMPVKAPIEVQRSGMGNASETLKANEDLKIMHKVRLKNTGNQPFTTAPAMVLDNNSGKDVLLAQSMITYAPPGATADLTLTTAIDLKATKKEIETGRQEGSRTWLDHKYASINLQGDLTVTNFGNKAVKLEINRLVVGHVDGVSGNGSMLMLNGVSDGAPDAYAWWHYYLWPDWWNQMNGLGKFTFKGEIAPQQKMQCDYKWHYLWR